MATTATTSTTSKTPAADAPGSDSAVQAVHRLRISASIWKRLRAHHLARGKHTEAISLALGHVQRSPDGELIIVLAREDGLLLFADDCYLRRSYGAAVLRRDVRAKALWRAVQEGWTAVVDIHDHHFAEQAVFSDVDDRDDHATAAYFASTLPAHTDQPLVAAALLLARQDATARFVGGAKSPQWGTPMRLDVVGLDGLSVPGLLPDRSLLPAALAARHLRHTAILPAAVQVRLAVTHAAVVGCGGTGSIAADALARLGVGRLTLIDGDRVEPHNLNRLQSCGVGDIGRFKADVLAERIASLLPDVRIEPVCTAVHEGAGRTQLPSADIVFGCLDNAETRWWLNRHALMHLQPYFDVGVLVEPGDVPRMLHRVNIVIPGAGPCGHCSPREFIPRHRPAAFMDAQTLRVQREAGYLLGSTAEASGADPSLYGLNLQAVGSLMQEFALWARGGPVAHALVQSTAEGLLQRLPLQAFGGAPASDCPVCATLLGAAGSAAAAVATGSSEAEARSEGLEVQAALAATFEEIGKC